MGWLNSMFNALRVNKVMAHPKDRAKRKSLNFVFLEENLAKCGSRRKIRKKIITVRVSTRICVMAKSRAL